MSKIALKMEEELQLSWEYGQTFHPYSTSSHEQTGDIIIFAKLDEGGLVGENILQKKMNPFRIQLMSYLQTMTTMKDI